MGTSNLDKCAPCDTKCLFAAYNSEAGFREAVLNILCGLLSATATDTTDFTAVKTSVEIMDDWDETDRAKVNPVVGQAGVEAGGGVITAKTQRVTLATDGPGVANLSTLAGAVASSRMNMAAKSSFEITALSDASITIASLATSATWLVGRQSASIATAGYEDILCAGKITVGTTPTASTRIELWCVGSIDGTNWPDAVAEADAARTWTTAGIKYLGARQIAFIDVLATTSDVAFPIPLTSIRNAFEGVLPKEIVFFVTHNTGANLNATAGNHMINVAGVRKALGA